jgi:outer membrane lipoprotein-sorting protein
MGQKSGLVLTMALTACCATAGAQMVVHAVSGTVKAINAAAKTMDVTVDSGDTSEFKLTRSAKVTLDFDNALRSDAMNADKFQKLGDYAVVYYYGYGDDETAVAVKDLGAGPFQKIDGTVVNFDKHSRTMTVKDDGGKTETFELGPHLVVDLGMSVENGRSYDPHKGYSVRVTYTNGGGKNTAVFVRSRE